MTDLSRRDLAAMMAMQGLLANGSGVLENASGDLVHLSMDIVMYTAIQYADMIIAELDRTAPKANQIPVIADPSMPSDQIKIVGANNTEVVCKNIKPGPRVKPGGIDVWANVFADGGIGSCWRSRERAEQQTCNRIRLAHLVEIEEGEGVSNDGA